MGDVIYLSQRASNQVQWDERVPKTNTVLNKFISDIVIKFRSEADQYAKFRIEMCPYGMCYLFVNTKLPLSDANEFLRNVVCDCYKRFGKPEVIFCAMKRIII